MKLWLAVLCALDELGNPQCLQDVQEELIMYLQKSLKGAMNEAGS